MAEIVTVHLLRSDSSEPWGFRLHGGKDFGFPLKIMRVIPGSIASKLLNTGDTVLKIGSNEAVDLEHMDANDLIRRSGNQIVLKIKKGHGIIASPISTPMSSPLYNVNGPGLTASGPPPPPAVAPPPPPPPPPSGGMGAAPSWKQQPQQESVRATRPTIHPSMMGPKDGPQPFAYVPEGLLKTMQTADKKPFTYTPAGLTPKDLQSPGSLRRNRLQQPGLYPHILPNPPRAPMNYPSSHNTDVNRQQSSSGNVYNPYDTPIDMYSNNNLSNAIQQQTGYEYPSDVAGHSRQYNPHQVHHGQHSTVYDEPRQGEDYYPSYKGYVNPTIQSRSFKMLQRMTGADDNTEPEPVRRQPSYDEDDMRFTSLNKGRIPSRSFQMLQRMTGADKDDEIIKSVQNEPEYNQSAQYFNPAVPDYAPTAQEMTEEEAEQMRYRGGSIPSRSFRMLQEMTGEAPGCEGKPNMPPPEAHQTPPTLSTRAMQGHTFNDPPRPRSPMYMQQAQTISQPQYAQPQYARPPSPPYAGPGVRTSEMQVEPEPKKYTGAYIPGKAFQMLQAMTSGDENAPVVPSVLQSKRGENNQVQAPYGYSNLGAGHGETDF